MKQKLLVDATSGEELTRVYPYGTFLTQKAHIALEKWQGRTVRLQMIDRYGGSGWIGMTTVALTNKAQ